ncbi:hypothetical protein HDU93_001633 [Gonapodya sp. JEL0774]|nr:hypothetical protein HDU93_001633 [Gonapodya sp. JEL0774]
MAGSANGVPQRDGRPFIAFPEWTEQDIAGEKWATKHPFEDTHPVLPGTLRGQIDSYKRIVDFIQDPQLQPLIVVAQPQEDLYGGTVPRPPSRGAGGSLSSTDGGLPETDIVVPIGTPNPSQPATPAAPHRPGSAKSQPAVPTVTSTVTPDTPTDSSGTRPNSAGTRPASSPDAELSVACSRFFVANGHLLSSPLMRSFLSAFSFLLDQHRQLRAAAVAAGIGIGAPGTALVCPALDDPSSAPWDRIYPKGKDGLPSYNSSGKYAVKLYHLGAWRKIVVDDRVPVDAKGKPLLIRAPTVNEAWPAILCKAMLKVAAASYRESDPLTESSDFHPLHCLTSHLPERIRTSVDPANLWTHLCSLQLRPVLRPSTSGAGSLMSTAGTLPAASMQALAGKSTTKVDTAGATKVAPGPVPGAGGPSFVTVWAYKHTTSSVRPTEVKAGGNIPTSPTVVDPTHLPFPFRVVEVRESAQSSPLPGISESVSSVASMSPPPLGLPPSGKLQKIPQTVPSTAQSTGFRGATFAEVFGKLYHARLTFIVAWASILPLYHLNDASVNGNRHIEVLQSPTNFKFLKQVAYIPDPAKPQDAVKITPVLYIPDDSREAFIVVCVSSVARSGGSRMRQPCAVDFGRYSWREPCRESTTLRISTGGTSCRLFRIPSGLVAYKLHVDCSTAYCVTLASNEEFIVDDEARYLQDKLGLKVKDVDETLPATLGGCWTVLFKCDLEMFHCFFAASVHMAESLQHAAALRVVDNDTGKEMPGAIQNAHARTYLPNKNGYTLLADCKYPPVHPACKWKLRLIAEASVIPLFDRVPNELALKATIQDFEEVFVPNRHSVLFRSILKIKDAPENIISAQLMFEHQGLSVQLQLFDNEVEIYSAKGRGCAIIYAATLQRVDETPATVSAGGKDAKLNAAEVKHVTKSSHKYIIQGTVEAADWSKLFPSSSANASSDVGRPSSSRNTKITSSAKKKKGSEAAPNVSASAAPVTSVGSELTWKLRLVSSEGASLSLAKDTEQEDRYRAIKDSWELKTPGRAQKARELREQYLKQTDVNLPVSNTGSLARPIGSFKDQSPGMKLKAPTQESSESGVIPRVLTPEEKSQREAERMALFAEFEQSRDALLRARPIDRERRALLKQLQIQKLEEKRLEVDKLREIDMKRREEYLTALARAVEEWNVRKLELGRLAADAASAMADEEERGKAKKKTK